MAFYIDMLRLRQHLDHEGVRTIIPDGREFETTFETTELYDAYKRQISIRYLDQIRHWVTTSLLVLNYDRHGVASYIGPSTFAEVAVACAHRKRVYLVGDYPAEYADELIIWDVIPLYGRLDQLIEDYKEVAGDWKAESDQLSLPGF